MAGVRVSQREVLREQHVGHRRGVSLVVVIGRVAYGRLDTAPPRVGAERAVVAREARPAEAKARLETGKEATVCARVCVAQHLVYYLHDMSCRCTCTCTCTCACTCDDMCMCTHRWGVPLEGYSGEEYLQALADRRFTVCCGPVLRPKARTSQRGWR